MKKTLLAISVFLISLNSNAVNYSSIQPWIGFTLHRSKPGSTGGEYVGTPRYLKYFYTNPDFGIETGITKKWSISKNKKYIKTDISLGYTHYNLHLFHPDLFWTNGIRYSPAYGYLNRNCISVFQYISYPLNKFLHLGVVFGEHFNIKTIGDNSNHLLFYNGFTDSTGAVYNNSKIDLQTGLELSCVIKKFKIGTGGMFSLNSTNMKKGGNDRYRFNKSLFIKIAYNFNSK